MILLKDGGTGQELLKRSKMPPHPLWSAKVMLEEPLVVQAVHEDFIRAGSRLITLNTYSATPERLEREGVPELFLPLQQKAIELVQAARENVGASGVKIAACLPPLRGSYQPDMSRSHDDLLTAYRQIVAPQVDAADVILCETLSSINELTSATQAAVETGIKTFVSMTLMDDGTARLRSGEALGDALNALQGAGQAAVLLNCSKPEIIDSHLPTLAKTGGVVGAYANGFTGVEALKLGGTVDGLSARVDLTPARYTEHAMGWLAMGATLLGGCCEVGPAHIRNLATALSAAGHEICGAFE